MASETHQTFGDITVSLDDAHVATVEIHHPPHNFFSLRRIHDIANAFDSVDANADARAILFCTEGKNFCAGADFEASGGKLTSEVATEEVDLSDRHLYDEAVRLFSTKTPVVAAVQGAAVGGGFGLACMADFRVGGPGTRLTANFARLGFHQGFGLSATLPRIAGNQAALELLYTGRRIKGDEGHALGLLDRYTEDEQIRNVAYELAAEIAASAPLAVQSIKETMRGDLPAIIRAVTDREKAEQDRLTQTEDWTEGVKAMSERRVPDFKGQ